MLLDLEKAKQPVSGFILLKSAGIPAQVLRVSGHPSHKSDLAPSTEKAPHLTPIISRWLFYYLHTPPGCHYLRMLEIPTHNPFL